MMRYGLAALVFLAAGAPAASPLAAEEGEVAPALAVDQDDRQALARLAATLPEHGVPPASVPALSDGDDAWRALGAALVDAFAPVTWPSSRRSELVDRARPMGDAIDALVPRHWRYEALKTRYARVLHQREHGPAQTEIKPPPYEVRVGRTAPEVEQLRDRLLLEGYGDVGVKGRLRGYFDHRLKRALWNWQKDNGLPVTVILDHHTRRKLNVPVPPLHDELALAMARWRMTELRSDEGDHVIVHINAFELEAQSDGEARVAMPVIVGRATRLDGTPTRSAPVELVVVQPSWRIPRRIVDDTLRKRVGDDADILRDEGLEVTIDESGRWWVRQPPGPDNPLGRVKFTLKGTDGVYLHDTNRPELFAQTRRALSHGCIRLADPLALARWMLPDKDLALDEALARTDTTALRPERPITTHFVYQTLTIDRAGRMRRHPDVYRSAPDGRSLMEGPSAGGSSGNGGGGRGI